MSGCWCWLPGDEKGLTHNWIRGKVQLGKRAENSHSSLSSAANLSGELGAWLWPSGPHISTQSPPPPPSPHVASSHSPELKAMRMLQSSFLQGTQDSCFSDPGALAHGPCSCLHRRRRQAGATERTKRAILSEICSHSLTNSTNIR